MIYSIGHGNKKIVDFINELKSFDVKYVIDVRSSPFSKYNPQFNQNSLRSDLQSENITYVFLGENLGGLPRDRSCYTDGKVDYEVVKEKPFFKIGLERLLAANKQGLNIAVMCSESKPEECHRSKLIGQALLKYQISVLHILSVKKVKEQMSLMLELTKGANPLTNLFGDETNFTSRKKYQ